MVSPKEQAMALIPKDSRGAGWVMLPHTIPPGLFSGFIGWIVVGLLIFGAIFLWKNFNSTKTARPDRLTDTLNAINERLAAIEKNMNRPEKDNK